MHILIKHYIVLYVFKVIHTFYNFYDHIETTTSNVNNNKIKKYRILHIVIIEYMYRIQLLLCSWYGTIDCKISLNIIR